MDPKNIEGQAPPYFFQDIKPGSQLWYGIIEPAVATQNVEIRERIGSDVAVIEVDKCFLYISVATGELEQIIAGPGRESVCDYELLMVK